MLAFNASGIHVHEAAVSGIVTWLGFDRLPVRTVPAVDDACSADSRPASMPASIPGSAADSAAGEGCLDAESGRRAVCEHIADMRRFARRRIRDEALAEDAVQDALVAALVALPRFRGQSTLRTWLLGILNHKIQDAFRHESRYLHGGPLAVDEIAAGAAQPWEPGGTDSGEADPGREVVRRRFMAAVVSAVEALPLSLRQVFLMQAIEGLPTDQVCRDLGISEANCWVRLHRARKRLSAQLQGHY